MLLETLENDLSSLRGNQTSMAIDIQKVQGLVENQEMILQSLRPAIYQSSQYMRGRIHNLVTDNCNRLQVCRHYGYVVTRIDYWAGDFQ